jgi:hypothetical protein
MGKRITFGLAGFILMVLGSYFLLRSYPMLFVKYATKTTGKVIEIIHARYPGRNLYPKIAFTAQNGEPITFSTGIISKGWNPQIGDLVEVDYDPANPAHAGVYQPKGLRSFLIIFVIGLAALLNAIFQFIPIGRNAGMTTEQSDNALRNVFKRLK